MIKKILVGLILIISLSLFSGFVVADFQPYGNIDLSNLWGIFNATSINSTEFYQNGNQVLDTSGGYFNSEDNLTDLLHDNYVNLSSPALRETADYVIWKDGSTVKAKNSTGHLEFSSTNASYVFQSCRDQLVTDGGKIFVNTGTYNITSQLNWSSYITLQGAGMYMSILKLDAGVNDYMFKIWGDSTEKCNWIDIQFDGNGANNNAGGILYLDRARSNRFERVMFKSANETALVLNSSTSSWGYYNRITDCIFELNNVGILQISHDRDNIVGCLFSRNKEYGFWSKSGSEKISYNDFYSNGNGIYLQDTGSCTITHNDFDYNKKDDIYLWNSGYNQIKDNKFGGTSTGYSCIYSRYSGNYNQFIGNMFNAPSADYNIKLYWSSSLHGFNNTVIKNNQFKGYNLSAMSLLAGQTYTIKDNIGYDEDVIRNNLEIVGDLNITGDLEVGGNITLSDKITFALGETIDNLVNGVITIVGNLVVDGTISFTPPVECTGGSYMTYFNGTDSICVTPSEFLLLTGGTMSGDIDMGGNNLTNSPALQETADYVIWKDGSLIKAKNSTGHLILSGTDASTIINGVLDDCSHQDADIYIKPAEYIINESIIIIAHYRNGLTIRGGGHGTVLKAGDNLSTPIITHNLSTNPWEVIIKDLKIDGNYNSNNITGIHHNIYRSTIDNIFVTKCYTGLNVSGSILNSWIMACDYRGINLRGDTLVQGCFIGSNGLKTNLTGSCGIGGISSWDNRIIGSHIYGNWKNMYFKWGSNNMIIGNLMESARTNHIYADGYLSQSTIIGNRFEGYSSINEGYYPAIHLEGDHNTITGNRFGNRSGQGYVGSYAIEEVSSCSGENTIIANDFYQSYTTAPMSLACSHTNVFGNGNDSEYQVSKKFQSNGEGLVSYWSFDEKSGSIAYDAENDNDGTVSSATITSGRFSKGLSFDGADSVVNCGNDSSLDITTEITVEAWIYPKTDGEGGYGRIMTKNDNAFILNVHSNLIEFTIKNSTGNSHKITSDADSITYNNWYHIIGTYDGTTQKIYVSGLIQDDTEAWSDTIQSVSDNIYIGNRANLQRTFNGTIDEVKIWNRSLTSQEVMGQFLLGLSSHRGGGEKLDKTGDQIDGDLNVTGDLDVTGNITADNVFIPADIFVHTNVSMSVASAGVWYNITFTHNGATIKQGINHTYNDNTNDTIYVESDGIYDIKFKGCFNDTSANPDDYAFLRVTANDVEITGSGDYGYMSKQNAQIIVSGCARASLSAGDEIKLQFTGTSTNTNLQVQSIGYLDHVDSARLCMVRIR